MAEGGGGIYEFYYFINGFRAFLLEHKIIYFFKFVVTKGKVHDCEVF